MKKIKKRIKRALAALLREELMEYIGYNHNIPLMPLNDRFCVDRIDFETLILEREIDLSGLGDNMRDPRFTMEDVIHDCKRQFADRVMEHIHVEAQNLTSHEHYMRRSVKLILRVQKKKK